jgi:hypothetical protein
MGGRGFAGFVHVADFLNYLSAAFFEFEAFAVYAWELPRT